MASTVCNALTSNIVSRKCQTSGGIKNKAWVFQVDDLTGVETKNVGGTVSSFGLKTGYTAMTATGRPKKQHGDNKLSKPEDGAVSVEQALTLNFSYSNQEELDAIMDFLRAESKTVFVETNAGTIRQYFHEYGDSTLEGTDGTGTLIGDGSGVVEVTLKGTESVIPRFFEAVIIGGTTQLASSKTYLDGLVAAAQ